TWPSPAMTVRPSLRTARMVVPCQPGDVGLSFVIRLKWRPESGAASGFPRKYNGSAEPYFHQCKPLQGQSVPPKSLYEGRVVLHRVIYASEAVGATGASTLSVAQILGVSERNNRRDHLT